MYPSPTDSATPKRGSTTWSGPSWSSEPALQSRWSGCLGARLGGDAEGYGHARGEPLVDVDVAHGGVHRRTGRQIWRLTGEVVLPDGPRAYDQALVRTDDGAVQLVTGRATLEIDAAARRLTVDAPSDELARQLVTTYGLPLILEDAPALVLHACSAVPPDREEAVVICAPSGTGKSSLLLALIAAGWRSVAEDVSTVDLRNETARVWPGPPWVRRAGVGPPGAKPLYELPDKTAWDMSSSQVEQAMSVGRFVFMESPGGDEPLWEPLGAPPIIRSLVGSSICLSDPHTRGERTFHAAARLARRIPAARLRLPVSEDWSVRAESVLRRAFERG